MAVVAAFLAVFVAVAVQGAWLGLIPVGWIALWHGSRTLRMYRRMQRVGQEPGESDAG